MSSNPFSLAGKGALVVGADSGIGLACARGIANAGAKLAIAGLDAGKGKGLAQDIAKESGQEVAYFQADVRDESQVKAMVDAAVKWLGGLDIAMNNAGIPGPAGPLQDIDADEFDNLFAINVKGAWLGMKYEVPYLLENGSGSIINLASTAALKGLPFVAPYAATKHAVAGLTRSAAVELANRKIRVNAIAPGPVDTGLLHAMRDARAAKVPGVQGAKVPMERFSDPSEMAGAVVWLASDASSFVTGAIVSVDGGVMAA